MEKWKNGNEEWHGVCSSSRDSLNRNKPSLTLFNTGSLDNAIREFSLA